MKINGRMMGEEFIYQKYKRDDGDGRDGVLTAYKRPSPSSRPTRQGEKIMKQLQISEALFVKMIKYFYSEEIGFDDEEIFDLEREIKKELQMKLDRITMRSYYTKYKTAETEQKREEARKKYLDEKGVPESFRW